MVMRTPLPVRGACSCTLCFQATADFAPVDCSNFFFSHNVGFSTITQLVYLPTVQKYGNTAGTKMLSTTTTELYITVATHGPIHLE
uniref:Purinergic receptor P2X, ligand-gated ion channel, 7 n=1 Tax=Nothobranchius furzeri TaxID=105023 RepID=A0A1A8V040_NOTFU